MKTARLEPSPLLQSSLTRRKALVLDVHPALKNRAKFSTPLRGGDAKQIPNEKEAHLLVSLLGLGLRLIQSLLRAASALGPNQGDRQREHAAVPSTKTEKEETL
jgi:hypothetical protein